MVERILTPKHICGSRDSWTFRFVAVHASRACAHVHIQACIHTHEQVTSNGIYLSVESILPAQQMEGCPLLSKGLCGTERCKPAFSLQQTRALQSHILLGIICSRPAVATVAIKLPYSNSIATKPTAGCLQTVSSNHNPGLVSLYQCWELHAMLIAPCKPIASQCRFDPPFLLT